MPAAASV